MNINKVMKRKNTFLLLILFLLVFPFSIYAQPIDSGDVEITAEVKNITLGKVVFEGRAYPNSYLHILKDGNHSAVRNVGPSFKEMVTVEPGTYDFSVWVESNAGRESPTLLFKNIKIPQAGYEKTISDIFIPPTIKLQSSQVEKGENLEMSGDAFPESDIEIIDSTDQSLRTTETDGEGHWSYSMNTEDVEAGSHWVKARAVYNGDPSSYSRTLNFDVESTPSSDNGGGGGGGGGLSQPSVETKARILGRAYPESKVTVLKDGVVEGAIAADEKANFAFEITDITAGIHTFGVWAEDSDGHRGRTYSFTTNIRENTITTIDNIFLPPTIDVTKEKVEKGDDMGILGQTTPGSTIKLHINSEEDIVKEFQAKKNGTWFYRFDTALVEKGTHKTRARAVSLDPEKLTSTFSLPAEFTVGEKPQPGTSYKKADINQDGRVDITDFSIMLYNWGPDFTNSRADINNDNTVDIRDFSILLYYWTG